MGREQKGNRQTDAAVQSGAVRKVIDACHDEQDGEQHKDHGGRLERQLAYTLDDPQDQHKGRKEYFQNEFHRRSRPF